MAELGSTLFHKLSQLKYPAIYKFNPSSFDWLFDNDEAFPFLHWLCSTVQTTNLITDFELKKFENLKKEGITILEGKRLAEAYDNHSVTVTSAELETAIEDLESVKEALILQKQVYVNQLNIYNSKGNIISRKIADLDSLNAGLEIKNEVLLSKLKCTDAMANNVLQSVNGLSSHVLEFFNEEKLLCQNSFIEYLAFEEECTACLTNYANKQFEQKMGHMGQNSGLEMCAFLQIGQSNFRVLLGLDEKARYTQNWELNCLQLQLPLAEEDRTVNETEVSSLTTALGINYQILATLVDGKFPLNHVDREYQNSLDFKSLVYSKELASLKICVKNAISKATQLRCSSIIVGDCSLKLLRQDFFIAKQKEFLSLLVQQWAREQLVLLAVRFEGRQLETLLSTLKHISQYLLESDHQLVERLVSLKQFVDLEKSLHNRNTIPRHDEASCSMKTILGLQYTQECGQDPWDYSELNNLAVILKNHFEEAKSILGQLSRIVINQQKGLEQLVFKLEELLFGFPLTSNTQKPSNLQFLDERIDALNVVRRDVQSQLKPLNRKFKTKQVVFKTDHLNVLERRLWTLFYTDVTSMVHRTNALNIKIIPM
ncbi:hypothetical protein DAPPUDRAFT_229597 [Daphnia pulex]|uniref:HAUS augmin-like complex subunit 3 N-terminal domain-containing protein n=1 Tax=Daphnia pulex TaxID=6669 RepID=E9HRN9_DAPPU|nr:hypothetical protein DAPPUDRAFT_229597 [Daphnia pulex]|eukprot:EFX65599.1 hypothetical protein DAPPUDRAFT_229597 [Daphnia pulex]